MNKWLIVIALAIVAAVVLAYTWQNIPLFNDFIRNQEIDVKIQQVKDTVMGTVNSLTPTTLIPTLVGSVGTLGYVIRNQLANAREKQITFNETMSQVQIEKGDMMAGFQDVKDTILGAKDSLQQEFDTLKVESETQITDLKELVDTKDNKIIDVQDELTKAQQELIDTQYELKEALTHMAEFRTELATRTLPTTH